jgi:hypothetical protein
MTEKIRRLIPREEFDYQMLLDCLKDYARPRDKISALLNRGTIIRVKKGLYVFGADYRKRPYSREVLANQIYGPSYVSLDYALSYYGMIPERVETVTSVTCGKNRSFSTPVGTFIYWSVPLTYYHIGVDLIELGDSRSFFMATREKALTDKLYHEKSLFIRNVKELESFLLENLRIDSGILYNLNRNTIEKITQHCRSRNVRLLTTLLIHNREDSIHE